MNMISVEEVVEIVSSYGDKGMKISELIDALSSTKQTSDSNARRAIIHALDVGKVRTDRNFRLHVTTLS
jgi:hypothetical protein